MNARYNFIGVQVAVLLTACSGNLPEPGHPQARPSDLPSPQPSATIAAVADTGEPQVDAANKAIRAADAHCERVKDEGSRQARSLSEKAYYKKQGGLLVTTVVGAVGAVVTSVLATTQKDSAGNSNAVPATAVGAGTAGATAIAGVVALFVVGPPPDDRIKDINAVPADVAAKEAKLDTDCATVTAATANDCKRKAETLMDYCDSKAKGIYPYIVNY